MSDKKKQSDKCAVYTIQQVADLLGCSKMHVCNLVDEGLLGAINIGTGAARIWRIEITEFSRFQSRNSSLNAGGGK